MRPCSCSLLLLATLHAASGFVTPHAPLTPARAAVATSTSSGRAGAVIMKGGGFESSEAAAARKAKQEANNQKTKAAKAAAAGMPPPPPPPPAAAAGTVRRVEVMQPQEEEQVARRDVKPAAPISEEEIFERFGIEGARRDKRGAYIPPGLEEVEAKKEITVTMFDVIPMELQGGIEKVLQIGIGLCLLFFLASGIALGWEAYAVTQKTPLPENIDNIIVNVLEPSFTPSLVVTLTLSSLLGIFKLGQLGRAGINYRE